MAAKTPTSGFSFLMRIPKFVTPFALFAVIGLLNPAVKLVYTNPLTAEISRHLNEMEKHTDPSSAEYARLLQETQQDARKLLLISIAVALVTLMLAFAKQIVARFFAASSTTTSGSGDGYSLAELLREVTKWQNLKWALVTTAVVITVSQLACMALVGDNFATVMREARLLSVRGSFVLAAFLASLYVGVLALVNLGVRRKEWSVLVLTTLLLPTLVIPVCEVAVLYLCTEQVMGLGPSLLSVYDLLQGVQDLLYLSAANVYCYCYYHARAVDESKEMACDGEKRTT